MVEEWKSALLDLVHALYPVAAFWVFTILMGLADFDHGLERSTGLLVACAGVLVIPSLSPRSLRRVAVILGVVVVGLLALRTVQAIDTYSSGRGPSVDIGQTTIAAVEQQAAGNNPYLADIDPIAKQTNPEGTGFRYYAGFKYGPIMTLAYTPGVRAAGAPGFFLTGYIALLVTAGAAAWWAFESGGATAAVGASALVLIPGFTYHELFEAGANDLVPVALLLIAFALRARGSGIGAGVALGLSVGAKLLPGVLIAIPIMVGTKEKKVSFMVSAAVTALVVHLPALVDSPKELIASMILFNLDRPPDSTSLLAALPEAVRGLVQVTALAASVGTLIVLVKKHKDLQQSVLAALSALIIVLFLIGGPAIHRNWLFWLTPLLAVAISTRIWRADAPARRSPTPVSAGAG